VILSGPGGRYGLLPAGGGIAGHGRRETIGGKAPAGVLSPAPVRLVCQPGCRQGLGGPGSDPGWPLGGWDCASGSSKQVRPEFLDERSTAASAGWMGITSPVWRRALECGDRLWIVDAVAKAPGSGNMRSAMRPSCSGSCRTPWSSLMPRRACGTVLELVPFFQPRFAVSSGAG